MWIEGDFVKWNWMLMILWGQRVKSTLNPVLHYAQVLKITWRLESWSKKIRKEKRKEVWKSLSMHALRQKVIQLWQGSFRNTFLTDKYRLTHYWGTKYSYSITIQYNDHFLNINYTINTTIIVVIYYNIIYVVIYYNHNYYDWPGSHHKREKKTQQQHSRH